MQEKYHFDDAHIQAQRSKLSFEHPKDLLCESKYPIQKMCVKSLCTKTSLFCNNEYCKTCYNDSHYKCTQVNVIAVTQLLNEHVSAKKDIVEKVGNIESAFVTELININYQFYEKIRIAGFEKQKDIIEEIFQKRNFKFLKGKEASQFFGKVEKISENKLSMKKINDLIKNYEEMLRKILKSITETKQLISNSTIPQHYIPPILFDSAILKLNQKHTEVLNKILNESGQIQSATRIFRASEHNFSIAAFHERCDNKEDTLILIRTEFGKTIGGYTHYPWTSAISGEWVKGSGHMAFLFSLDMREKFVTQGDGQLILRGREFGPIFGGGCDIRIHDCNSNRNSFANFPKTYNRAEGKKLERNKDTCRMFLGGENQHFKVEEYEVFQVFYK